MFWHKRPSISIGNFAKITNLKCKISFGARFLSPKQKTIKVFRIFKSGLWLENRAPKLIFKFKFVIYAKFQLGNNSLLHKKKKLILFHQKFQSQRGVLPLGNNLLNSSTYKDHTVIKYQINIWISSPQIPFHVRKFQTNSFNF